jgi:hypothetical protein
MIERELSKKLKQLVGQFPVIAVMGPRQSGKTTLVRHVFPDRTYVSLEDLEARAFAQDDPKGFLKTYTGEIILDEVQRVPELLSYIQTTVDESQQVGQFILTGSQNFLLHEKISQSLAGRVALLTLLPLSLKELKNAAYPLDNKVEDLMFKGFYPRLYDVEIAPIDWYPSYIQTYVERDVRQMKNIANLSAFQRFLKMAAARTGQLLNLSSLAHDCGITHNTASSWISVLEASYIIFLLKPHHKNFNKRLVKTPKLYFYDVGLACSLLGIENEKQLATHYLKGGLFESFVISEMIKYRLNRGSTPNCYFWRDKLGHEIDCLVETADQLIPIEIKSGKTIVGDYFKEIKYWQQLAEGHSKHAWVVYGGNERQARSYGNFISWKNVDEILEKNIA